jgi:DNA-binding transcriptional LysR family regulator
MELTQLMQFKAIAECKTMTEAADKIHISQPALSAALHNLEKELGLNLFDRQRNRMILNDAGKLTLSQVKLILELVENMKTELSLYSRKDKIFSVAFCDPGPMWYCVPQFSISNPDFEIRSRRFDEDKNVMEMVLNKSFDIIFSSVKLEHPDISSFLFIRDQLLLSVPTSHPLAKKSLINLRKTTGIKIAYFNGIMGSFHKKQLSFWAEMETKFDRVFYDDRELYGQIVRSTNVPTISTKLARHYRNDGAGRVLIPIIDPEFSIDYYYSFLKKNNDRLKPFTSWAARHAKNFVK